MIGYIVRYRCQTIVGESCSGRRPCVMESIGRALNAGKRGLRDQAIRCRVGICGKSKEHPVQLDNLDGGRSREVPVAGNRRRCNGQIIARSTSIDIKRSPGNIRAGLLLER